MVRGLQPAHPPAILVDFATDQDLSLREGVAYNPNAPAEILAALASDPHDEVRMWLAFNPNLPDDILAALACDQFEGVRSRVAENLNTPVSVLTALAADQDEFVRWGVGKNPNTSVSVLTALGASPDEDARCSVAANPNTPPSILTALAADPDDDVRIGVSRNPSARAGDLASLAIAGPTDPSRESAAANPSLTMQALRDAIESSLDRHGQKSQPEQPDVGAAKGNCYVATAVYGSYGCPEVWVLRRFRDQTLVGTRGGRMMVRMYYGVSPVAVRFGGSLLQRVARRPLTFLVRALRRRGVADTPYVD